ncbi:hypothetical protein FA95DRAFT_774829 [Auriscalpium vulgare]|uniref:Uncharacterized protein n=1 Tax=Auriscalpium vulgare TaxID=40419 RepID=A0ACB8S117_9AGAM|nr:hypothetical protein FA95DRAFT_774829 [Auriscalpium vulgare]
MAKDLSDPFLPALIVELYIYGVYTCLYGVTLHVLIRKFKESPTNKYITIAMTVMYLTASAHVVVDCMRAVWPSGMSVGPGVVADETVTSLATLNFVIGDGVVIWRAYIILERRRRRVVVPLLLLLLTLGLSILQIARTINFVPTITLLATLLTNVVVTGLIGQRAWRHYRSSSEVRIRIVRDRALAILLLLVESGALYSAIWIAGIIIISVGGNQYGTLVFCEDITPSSCAPTFKSTTISIYEAILPHVTGMYPTIIIVLCKLQASYSKTIMDMRDDVPSLRLPHLAPDAPSPNVREPVPVRFVTSQGEEGQGFLARDSSDTSLSSGFSVVNIQADKEQIA